MKPARNKILKLLIIIVLINFTSVSLIKKSAEASIVGSKMILSERNTSETRETSEKKIRIMLESKIVSEKLRSYGLSTEEVNGKLDNMSDEEIHQLAALSDRISAGGNGAVGIVIGILVVVVLVLLILFLVKRV